MLNYSTAVLKYSEDDYNFRALVQAHFYHTPLTELHDESVARLTVGMDQHTRFHKELYAIGEPFLEIYRWFVKDIALKGEDPAKYLYQRIPTWRVHLPDNVATGNFHRDSDFGHSNAELNFLVPLTRMADSSSVWVESEVGAKDYHPITMQPGEYLRFHGAVLEHGSKPNTTGQTRVSFDFRVLPKAAYRPNVARSVSAGVPFTVGNGGYYADGGEL